MFTTRVPIGDVSEGTILPTASDSHRYGAVTQVTLPEHLESHSGRNGPSRRDVDHDGLVSDRKQFRHGLLVFLLDGEFVNLRLAQGVAKDLESSHGVIQ